MAPVRRKMVGSSFDSQFYYFKLFKIDIHVLSYTRYRYVVVGAHVSAHVGAHAHNCTCSHTYQWQRLSTVGDTAIPGLTNLYRTETFNPSYRWWLLGFYDSTRDKDDTTVGVGHSRRYCNTGYDQSQGRRPSTLKCIGPISKGDIEPNHPSEINPNSDSRSRSDGRSRRFVQYRVDQSQGQRPRSLPPSYRQYSVEFMFKHSRNKWCFIDFIHSRSSAIGDTNQSNKSNRRTMCVTKWVDYSNKYGFGFQLSNNSVGILFNDNTRMMLAEDSTCVTHFLVSYFDNISYYFGMAFYRI